MAAQKTITRKPSAQAVKASKNIAKNEDIDTDFDFNEEETETKEPTQKKLQVKSQARNMSGTKRIYTDLFKLKVAEVIKYEGWDEDGNEHPESHPLKFSRWEHTHPFRTFDKKGSRIEISTPIGGHFHIVEWEEVEDGTPIIKSVSGPMVMGTKIVKGKKIKAPVPANEYDDHTHDVEYVRSAEIVVSATNLEATAIITADANKYAPMQGVK